MSNLPGVYGQRVDGGLRLPGPSVDGIHLKIGPALGGVVNEVASESDENSAVTDFVGGQLVESACLALEKISPVLMMRIATSIAGAYATRPNVVPAFAATLAAGAIPGIVQAAGDVSLEAVFSGAAAWDGGNLVFTGQDPTGAAQTETLLQATIQALGAGARTWRSARVWKAGTIAISKSAMGADAGTCTINQGLKDGQGSQTSDSLITLSGTPTNRWQVKVRFVRDGDVAGPAVPAFNYSLDGGDNYTADIALPVGGVYALPSYTGLTITVVGAAVKAGDSFSQETVSPKWNNGDLSAALAAANASNFDFEAVHIIGPCDAVLAATISSYITAAENQSSPKWYTVVIEADDQAPAIGSPPIVETPTAWINRISGASPGFRDFADYRIGAAAGFAEVLDPPSGRINRRSVAWPYIARLMSISVGTSPAATALGPLEGISKIYHDEDKREALDSQRFTTLRTFGRLQGFYVTLGRLLYPMGSDFQKIQSLRVINKCMRLVYDSLLFYIESKVKVDRTTGKILESQARAIELPIVTLLTVELGDDITEPRVQIDRNVNMIVDKKLRAKVGIVPVAYAEKVIFTIGLLNPALEIAA